MTPDCSPDPRDWRPGRALRSRTLDDPRRKLAERRTSRISPEHADAFHAAPDDDHQARVATADQGGPPRPVAACDPVAIPSLTRLPHAQQVDAVRAPEAQVEHGVTQYELPRHHRRARDHRPATASQARRPLGRVAETPSLTPSADFTSHRRRRLCTTYIVCYQDLLASRQPGRCRPSRRRAEATRPAWTVHQRTNPGERLTRQGPAKWMPPTRHIPALHTSHPATLGSVGVW